MRTCIPLMLFLAAACGPNEPPKPEFTVRYDSGLATSQLKSFNDGLAEVNRLGQMAGIEVLMASGGALENPDQGYGSDQLTDSQLDFYLCASLDRCPDDYTGLDPITDQVAVAAWNGYDIIVFSKNVAAATEAEFTGVVLHEFGHVLGLKHSASDKDAMYPAIHAQTAFSADDAAQFCRRRACK